MKKLLIIPIIGLLLSSVGFAQRNGKDLAGEAEVFSLDSKRPEEIASKYAIEDNELEKLEALKRPKLVFVFEKEEVVEIEKTVKISKVLDDYWRASIDYQRTIKMYGLSFNRKGKDAKSFKRWGNKQWRLRNLLIKTSIETQGIKRKITVKEAYAVIIFIDKITQEIAIKAKKVAGNFKNVSILSQPTPNVGNCLEKSGKAKIRVQYHKSGEVKFVTVVSSSGCSDFDFNSLEAAKRIKFQPAMLDGKPTTVSSIIVYNYSK